MKFIRALLAEEEQKSKLFSALVRFVNNGDEYYLEEVIHEMGANEELTHDRVMKDVLHWIKYSADELNLRETEQAHNALEVLVKTLGPKFFTPIELKQFLTASVTPTRGLKNSRDMLTSTEKRMSGN